MIVGSPNLVVLAEQKNLRHDLGRLQIVVGKGEEQSSAVR